MKKTAIFLLVLMLAGTVCAQTDGKGSGFVSTFEMRFPMVSLNDHPEFEAGEFEVAPGYGFNRRLSVYLPVTLSMDLFDKEGRKNFETTSLLGVGLGYSPLHDARQRLEISARGGSTLGGGWEYLYYDLGLRYGLGFGARSTLWLGAGVRCYDTYGGPFDNYCNLYISVGFRVDFMNNR